MTQPRRSARKRTQIKYEDNDNNVEEQQIVDNEIDVDVDGRKKRRRKTKSSSEKEKSTKSTKRDKRTKSTRKRIQKVADDADADADDDDEEYVNVDYNENEALDDVISVDDEYDDTVELDDDDDDDGDELVEEDDDLKTPKRKKRYRGKGRKSTSGSKKQRNYGSIEERTCPFCKKVFSIVTGLAYHIEHKVCQRATTTQSKRKSIQPGSYPYPKLKPNSKWITPYGVVQIIADSRIPSDHNKTCVPNDALKNHRIYKRKIERIEKRKDNYILYTAKKQRKTRNTLLKLYLQSKKQQQNGANRNDGSIDAIDIASKIWNEYCTLTTSSLILSGKYNQKLDNEMRKQIRNVENHPWNNPGEDPCVPVDSYPDRIVECFLIQDERLKVCDLNIKTEGEGRLTQVNAAKLAVKKAKQANNNQKDGEGDDDDDSQGTKNVHESRLNLYLRRKDFVNSYNPNIPMYQCQRCSVQFDSRVGLKDHVDKWTCVKKGEKKKKDRASRLEAIEDAVATNNIKAPQPLTDPAKAFDTTNQSNSKQSKKIQATDGLSTAKRKKYKKWPAWLEFYPSLSTIYPVVFESMKFKRGSNNSKFVQKKWNSIGPGRKKVRKSRAKPKSVPLGIIDDVQKWVQQNTNQSVYLEVMQCLFPEFRSNEDIVASNTTTNPIHDTVNVIDFDIDQDQDFQLATIDMSPTVAVKSANPIPEIMPPLPTLLPMVVLPNVSVASPMAQMSKDAVTTISSTSNEKKQLLKPTQIKNKLITNKSPVPTTSQKKKRKRSKAPVANPKPVTPVIVDIRPLVEEIRAGRYPSMKEYIGTHPDICFVCKNKGGDDLYFCEFCENAEHLSCVQSKVTIRDPEPDDEFMCHRCIQTVMARRARAERRRLQKLEEAMGKNHGNSSGNHNTGLSIEEAKAASAVKREIVWNQADFDAHVISYKKCPTGGPGGLICCAPCTAVYSRMLSETSMEMDSQTVSSIGRDVSELMQLLHDAQVRLKQSVDISNSNDTRMGLLSEDQVSFDNFRNSDDAVGLGNGIMDYMDIFNGK